MRKEFITTPSAESLAEVVKKAQGTGLPPVHLWDPPLSGEMDLQIRRDGRWIHEGGEIRRFELVRLFSTILKKEGEAYFLVTPVEKWEITVEDAPFIAVDVEVDGADADQTLIFSTNVGDRFVAGAQNRIRVAGDLQCGEPSPYVMVRDGLEARIDRKSFYRLIELGAHQDGWFGLWSDGVFFNVIPSEDMME